MSKKYYWLLYAVVQTAGIIVPRFGNVHTHPFSRFLALVLLFPGWIVAFDNRLSTPVALALAIPINAVAWYVLRRLLLLDSD